MNFKYVILMHFYSEVETEETHASVLPFYFDSVEDAKQFITETTVPSLRDSYIEGWQAEKARANNIDGSEPLSAQDYERYFSFDDAELIFRCPGLFHYTFEIIAVIEHQKEN